MSAPTRASVCTICRCSIYLYTLHFYLPVVDRWSRSWRGIYCAQCRAQSRLDDSCVLRDACVVESGPYLSILIESPGFDLFAMLLGSCLFFWFIFLPLHLFFLQFSLPVFFCWSRAVVFSITRAPGCGLMALCLVSRRSVWSRGALLRGLSQCRCECELMNPCESLASRGPAVPLPSPLEA